MWGNTCLSAVKWTWLRFLSSNSKRQSEWTEALKTLVMHHSDTCRQHQHSLSHYQAFIEAGCHAETQRSLLQMLHKISISPQREASRMSASISIAVKRKYLHGKHSNWIFDHKSTPPKGVHLPSGFSWNLQVETGEIWLRTRKVANFNNANPGLNFQCSFFPTIGATLSKSPATPLTIPVLTSVINKLLSWAIELASLWIDP